MAGDNFGVDLKLSSERVGKLYPVLLDRNGNVIDGEHRLHADKNWPSVRLDHIESERDRLVARLVGNVCRREVASKEKSAMLRELGELYLKEGVSLRKLARSMAGDIGMSYRWVMKYLPEHLKSRPGLGGPSSLKIIAKSEINGDEVAQRATEVRTLPFSGRKEIFLTIKEYSNASFITVILDRLFYTRIKRISETSGIAPEVIISEALISTVRNLERIDRKEFSEKTRGKLVINREWQKGSMR